MLDNYNGATPPGTFTLLQIHLGDGYSSAWGNGRDAFYSVSGTPDAWFDGVLEASGAYTNVDSQYTWYMQQYNQRRAVPTDVTIALGGAQTSGQTFQFTADVCVEPGGTAKTMRVHMVQVLDNWPAVSSYSRHGVKQGAAYADITVNPGQCQQVVRSFTFDTDSWNNQSNIKVIAFAQAPNGSSPANVYQAAEAGWPFMLDCNVNGIADECDLDCGLPNCAVPGCGGSADCDGNDVPDECQPDCNGNDVADACDITAGTSLDCQANGTPDECEVAIRDCNADDVPDDCDITAGTSLDCQANGTPDECEVAIRDCNADGVPDDCDITAGISLDCQPNGTPDECEVAGHDCNANQVPDVCDIAGATSADCQPNGQPDECDITAGTSTDCQTDGIPDECQTDCNANGVADACDVNFGTSQDCNTNGRPDECDTEHCHYLWNGFQDSAYETPINGLDLDGDGHAWSNPSGLAYIWAFGCESGEGTDLFAQVRVPTTNPQNGYVVSEYFRTDAGTLFPDEQLYSLSFDARLKIARNAKTDWQLLVYDAVSSAPAVHIQFASTVSNYPGISVPADRGYILVKNRLGSPTFVNTGVATVLNTCTEFRVELNNLDHTVQLYIDGTPRLNPPVVVFNADAQRLDYFRLTAVSNGASAGGSTMMELDAFHLCATGQVLPAAQWDCNGNGVLDDCDLTSGFSHDCNANGVPEECELGDFDASQTVDLTDYLSFQGCLTDPGGTLGAGCEAGDFDCDSDVDLDDFAWFQVALPGR